MDNAIHEFMLMSTKPIVMLLISVGHDLLRILTHHKANTGRHIRILN